MWAELAVLVGVLALGQSSPGPDLLLVTRTAVARGRAAGWWTALGISTGLCVHAALAIGGVSILFAQGGWLATGLRWAAAGYLGWLGCQLCMVSFVAFYSGISYDGPKAVSGDGAMACWRRGLLCNILNLKVALFFAGVMAPFLAGDRPGWWPLLLWAILVGEGLFLWALWVWVLQFKPIRNGYLKAGKWIDAAFGIGLIALALALALRG